MKPRAIRDSRVEPDQRLAAIQALDANDPRSGISFCVLRMERVTIVDASHRPTCFPSYRPTCFPSRPHLGTAARSGAAKWHQW